MNASSDPTRVPCWRRAIMWAMQPWLQAHGIVKVQTVIRKFVAVQQFKKHPVFAACVIPPCSVL